MSLLVSASQISLFRDGPDDEGCKRKGAFRYVANINTPGTKAQDLGKDTDDNQLQPYLRDDKPFDLTKESGRIASSGLHMLPPPKYPGLEVQKGFEIPSPSKLFGYRGFLDLWLPKRGLSYLEDELIALGHTCLSNGVGIPIDADFKTAKDLRWAKTPEQLAVDVQAQLYAFWAMWKTRSKVVDLVWMYFQTQKTPTAKTYKTKHTHLRVDDKHVYEQFLGIEKSAREIYELRTRAEKELGKLAGTDCDETRAWALSLPPNTNACSKFGGCPHQHLCNLSGADFIDSIEFADLPGAANKRFLPVMTDTIDLFADLEARSSEPVAVVETVGINPPEKALPLAPMTGAVEAPDPVDVQVGAEPPKEKAKRGRKPKATAASIMQVTPAPEGLPTLNEPPPDDVVVTADEAWPAELPNPGTVFAVANRQALILLEKETDLDKVTRMIQMLLSASGVVTGGG
jgi:hypothetical protein